MTDSRLVVSSCGHKHSRHLRRKQDQQVPRQDRPWNSLFLSHPGMLMLPSYAWATTIISTASAMRSLEGSEYDIPTLPCDLGSATSSFYVI